MGPICCAEFEYETNRHNKEKLKHAVILYGDMEKWYADFLESEKRKECIRNLTMCYLVIKGYQTSKRLTVFFGA